MNYLKIEKTDWDAGLDRARNDFRLVGPIKAESKDWALFRELTPGELPDMEAAETVLSPKTIVYPQSEVLFEYTTDKEDPQCNRLVPPQKDYSPRAVVGIHPYDAAAFLILKKNFDAPEYKDNYWCDAYAACTFIGLAVNSPSPTDFSTSTGTGPFAEEGLDVLLVDVGDHYLAKVLTDKGQKFMDAAGWNTTVDSQEAEAVIGGLKAEAEGQIQSKVAFDNIEKRSIMELYNAEFWEDVAFSCINCGTCTYVCPTCWCFDIQDQNFGKQGKRFKNWDTCMETYFTTHASGHNPREAKIMRVRQRFMHKLKYYLDKYEDGIMCVGCGRCVRSCPVNIDIRKVCEEMNNYDPEACVCPV